MDNQIFFHIFNDKNELKTRRLIKISNILVFSIFFILLIDLSYRIIIKKNIEFIPGNSSMPGFSLTLSLILGTMAYISSLIYYASTKKDDFFIISLIYMNLSLELLITQGQNLIVFNKFILINTIFRIILLFYVDFNKEKISQLIIKHKVTTSIIIFLFSVITPIINYKIFSSNLFSKHIKLYSILLIIVIILYIVSCIFLANKSLKDCELIYSFIIASILLIALRGLFCFYEIILPNLVLLKTNNIIFLTILSFLLAISGVFNEITAKNKKSSLLQNELQVFYHLVEFNTSSSIILYDSKSNVIYANKAIRENYCKSDNLKDQLKEVEKLFVDSIFIDDTNENVSKSLSSKGYWDGKFTLNSGKIVSTYIQELKIGNKNYYSMNLKDITEEYTLTKSIKRNEQLLSCINNNIQDLIISVDNNGTITYVNDSALKTLNYKYGEVLGKPIINLLGKNDEILNQLKLDDQGGGIKCKLVGKHSFVYVESIIKTLKDSNEVPYGKVIVAKNLTSKKRLENLAIKFKEAKAYEQIRNEFFANISHELRTPLNIIYSTIQLLNSKHKNNPKDFTNFYDKYKQGLKINCYRMLRLINNLIDVSKIEVGFLKACFTNKDIVLLVENIVSLVIPHSENKDIHIIFDTNVEENIIKCDPVKIERLILNLLSNAIKFTISGGEIFVDLKASDDWVKISIKDDGIGIPKEMQASIFDRFVQADKSLKRRNEGSGIGLSIVKSIAELHGGKIELISNGVKGSEFVLWLPNVKLDYAEESNSLVDYITDDKNIELELSDIYEVN